jgi:hypothetical protein
MAMVGGPPLGEAGFPRHGGVDLPQQEGFAGVFRGQVHDLEVRLSEAGLLEQDAKVEVRDATVQDGDRPALEVRDGPDVPASENSVVGARVVQHEHADLQGLIRIRERRRILERRRDGVDLAAVQAGIGGGVLLDPDQLDLDAFPGKEAFLLRNE